MIVLAGDIGGTKTLLTLARVEGTGVEPLVERRYPSGEWPEFAPLLADFLARLAGAGQPEPAAACLGVAGPVGDGKVKVTNLPWVLDPVALARQVGAPVRLLNDFGAVAHGIAALGPEDLHTLQPGEPRSRGVRAVIGAGTGLGHAILAPRAGGGHTVLGSELGHAEFAPADERQAELWRWLRARHGRASWEHVVSGPGLGAIYQWLVESGARPGAALARAAAEGDPAAAVSAAAGQDPVAREALALFVRAYGAQAGNLALACIPRGGLYVAGGIAPRLIGALSGGEFTAAFRAKGPMAGLMERIPVHVVLNPKAGLLGAALAAARAAE